MPLQGEAKRHANHLAYEKRKLTLLRPSDLSTYPHTPAEPTGPLHTHLPTTLLARFNKAWARCCHHEKGTFPFNSKSEMALELFRAGLEVWENKGYPEIDELARYLRTNLENDRMLLRQREVEKTFDKIKAVIDKIKDSPTPGKPAQIAVNYLHDRTEEITTNVPPSPARTWLLKRLKQEYSKLYKIPKARLPFSMRSGDAWAPPGESVD